MVHFFQLGLVAQFSLVLAAFAMPLTVAALIAAGGLSVAAATGLLFSAAIGVAGVLLVVRRVDLSIARFERTTQRLASGDLHARVYPPRLPQLAGLAYGLNTMARQLEGRVDALVRMSSEQEAILGNMVEGVITVDRRERIMRMNAAAIHLLDITSLPYEGRLVAEVIRHSEVQSFISRATAPMEPCAETLYVRLPEERIFEAYAAPLYIGSGEADGTLIVLHDVTRVRRLEMVRRDFVANVSHELRTPITSIKGFVETLQDGAMDDPELRSKFLGIIARHADRLNAIFSDLLTLARLESQDEGATIELSSVGIRHVLHGAIETCSSLAAAKGVILKLEDGDSFQVEGNSNLLEQAVINLVDNAVKYTEAGGTVTIAAERDRDFVKVSVADTGCGIEKVHLSRLFERFYRVDHGRSRKMGGTGLGLSIVKHIANVHGGDVSVQSTPGRGSTFAILLRPVG